MYAPAPPRYRLGQAALGDCDSGSAAAMAHQRILDTITCELQRKFTSSEDPRLFMRRLRLRDLFNAVLPSKAKDLHEQLRLVSDPLAQLLQRRVAPATRREMLAILFFAEYDLRFEPTDTTSGVLGNPRMSSSEKADRISDVNDMVAELLARRDTRAADALTGTGTPAASASSAIRPIATRLSTAQLDLFREFFPDGSGGINLTDFQISFEEFANGELRDPSVPGKREPNGGFFFLFAEFALLCVDSGIEESTWTRLLRVFVNAQEIFMHVYRPAPHRTPPPAGAALPATGPALRSLDNYSDSNFNRTGQSTVDRKRALRAKYAPMKKDALRRAAAENMRRAQRMP